MLNGNGDGNGNGNGDGDGDGNDNGITDSPSPEHAGPAGDTRTPRCAPSHICDASASDNYTAIHKTIPDPQQEHEDLVRQRQEHLDCFAAAAFDFARKTSSGKKRRELKRAIRALQRIDESIDTLARDLRAFATEETGAEASS